MPKASIARTLMLLSCACLLSGLTATPAYAATFPQSGNASLCTGNEAALAEEKPEGPTAQERPSASANDPLPGTESNTDGGNATNSFDQNMNGAGFGNADESAGNAESGFEGPAGIEGSESGGASDAKPDDIEGFLVVETGGRRDGTAAAGSTGQSGWQTSPSESEAPSGSTSPIGGKGIVVAHADSITAESYGPDSLTLSGTRVNDLAQAHSDVTFDFGSTIVSAPSEAIQNLELSDNDSVSVDMTGPDTAVLSVNNHVEDIPLQIQGDLSSAQQCSPSQDSGSLFSSSTAVLAVTLCFLGAAIGGIALARKTLLCRHAASQG